MRENNFAQFRTQVNVQNNVDSDSPEIDRGFTYRVTIASLLVGLVIATIVGLLLFGLARPLTLNEQGEINWTAQALLMPVSAVIVAVILFWSVFGLPLRVARRRGVILDPEIYPWIGAVLIGIVFVVGFVAAILLGII